MILRSVVLPQPLGPMIETNSPSPISPVIPANAVNGSPFRSNTIPTSTISIISLTSPDQRPVLQPPQHRLDGEGEDGERQNHGIQLGGLEEVPVAADELADPYRDQQQFHDDHPDDRPPSPDPDRRRDAGRRPGQYHPGEPSP